MYKFVKCGCDLASSGKPAPGLAGFDDDTILPTPGGYPPQMQFDPGQWVKLGVLNPDA